VTVTELELREFRRIKRGKVREVFDLEDALLFVATDRISAYDVVLPTPIPEKGRVLTQLSLFWFGYLRDVVPNHFITDNVAAYRPVLKQYGEQLAGRAMVVKKAEVLPVECVVRGYLAGSGWSEYQKSGTVCGEQLPAGLREAEKLPEPIFTPATKAETGHDENITYARMCEIVGQERGEQLRNISLALYQRARDYAAPRGIIVADTKFEFGLVNGVLTLVDEVLTPDSSRFWPAAEYAPGKTPPSFDKQYVRDYLTAIGWDKEPPAPALPEEVVEKTRQKYLDALRILTQG